MRRVPTKQSGWLMKSKAGFVSWLTSLLFVKVIVYGFNHGKSPLHHDLHPPFCWKLPNCPWRSGWLHQRDVSASGIRQKIRRTKPGGVFGVWVWGVGIHEITRGSKLIQISWQFWENFVFFSILHPWKLTFWTQKMYNWFISTPTWMSTKLVKGLCFVSGWCHHNIPMLITR